ncbi:MAG TPA: RNA polymerase sigma factor [bacterium]|nr:RNA polymerase sigma factor [bacterium]
MNPNERELVQRILKGDSAAFQELYDAHKKALIRACWYFLGNDGEVEDMVQETFIKALKNLEKFRFECSLGTWLNHIAVNLCRDHLEKNKKTLPFSVDFFSTHPSREQTNPYPEEALKLLREEIQKLEGKDKELITLREIKGLSYEAIANRLRMPVGSVTSGLFRARQKLIEKVREKLPKGWEEINS